MSEHQHLLKIQSNTTINDSKQINDSKKIKSARNITDVRNLVIGGGGITGYCYVSALKELFNENDDSRPKLSKIKNFIGTSIGSIIVTILSCTTDQQYLFKKFMGIDMDKLQDNSYFIMDIYRLYSKFGYNKGKFALSTMQDILKEVTGNKHITFSQHYKLTNNNLIIAGTNITNRKIIYFNRLTHPDMEIALAVRISMSVPLLFVPIKYTNNKFSNILGGEGVFVDGGIIDNYPVHFVLSDLYKLLNQNEVITNKEIENSLSALYNLNGRKDCDNMSEKDYNDYKSKQLFETISIKSFSKETMANIAPEYHTANDSTNDSITEFCSNLISIFMDNGLKRYVIPDIWKRTLKIDIGNISTTNFNVTEEDIHNMLDIGKKASLDFIEELSKE
jgi:NTE family protein